MTDNYCSDIMGQWRFSKDAINKMNQITDKTKIIERGGILCGRIGKIGEKRIDLIKIGEKKIDLISECKGTRCDIQQTDPFKTCTEQSYVDTFGAFHTHPGKIIQTLPSIADLLFQDTHGQLMCIGAPKAKLDRIICIKNKHINREDEIDRRNKLDDVYKLERKIRNLPFYTTKKEREDFNNRFNDIFSEKYYYKFDPSKCVEK